jgi:hypothetical protein
MVRKETDSVISMHVVLCVCALLLLCDTVDSRTEGGVYTTTTHMCVSNKYGNI